MVTISPGKHPFNLPQTVVSFLAILVLLIGLGVVIQSDSAYRLERADRLEIRAKILAASVTAAVDFSDRAAARDAMSAVRVDSSSRVAAVYDGSGKLLAGFARPDQKIPESIRPDIALGGSATEAFASIDHDGVRIGTVYLSSDPIPFSNRVARFALIVAFAIGVSLIVLILSLSQRTLRTANSDLARAIEELRSEVNSREAAEAQLRQVQKMESIGQLTGGIAHDFNNMLAIILGGLDLAERRMGQPDKVKLALQHAREGANRAADLTRRLLAFARQQPLQPQILEVNQLVGKMSELLRRTLGEGVAIETVLSGGLWRTCADPGQLENAVLNLSVNARDAMEGSGKLTIETLNAHLDDAYAKANNAVTPGQYVVIAISDTGPGMAPDIIARAFEPFFTTKEVGKGTGLGLAQVDGFVRQSGGHVAIYSEIGQGTTIKIYLPRHIGTEQLRASHVVTDAIPQGLSSEVILVVEDEFQVRQMSTESLRELGYSVVEAANGREALALLESNRDISLLFTDIVMPGMNGRQLADQVHKILPDLPVLYTTGYTRNAIIHNGMVDQGIEFLPKPFTFENLARKVRAVLDARLSAESE